jgi:hypothetical protein
MRRRRGLPSRIRHWYHKGFGRHHGRFVFASIVTMVLVASVAVPYATQLLEPLDTYGSGPYDPKDVQRTEWLCQKIDEDRAAFRWRSLGINLRAEAGRGGRRACVEDRSLPGISFDLLSFDLLSLMTPSRLR